VVVSDVRSRYASAVNFVGGTVEPSVRFSLDLNDGRNFGERVGHSGLHIYWCALDKSGVWATATMTSVTVCAQLLGLYQELTQVVSRDVVDCPVCGESSPGQEFPCRHGMCTDCYAAWRCAAPVMTCPVCRASQQSDLRLVLLPIPSGMAWHEWYFAHLQDMWYVDT